MKARILLEFRLQKAPGVPMLSSLSGETVAMPNATVDAAHTLADVTILREVNSLRKTDNVTNWYYLAREYALLAAVVGGTIAFYYFLERRHLSLLWAVPLTLLAIVCVGAGQHRLATLTHE